MYRQQLQHRNTSRLHPLAYVSPLIPPAIMAKLYGIIDETRSLPPLLTPTLTFILYHIHKLLSFKLSLCNCCWLCVCIVVVACVCCYLMCTCCTGCVYCCFTLDAGLLARTQYSEGPATGHLDTGFYWFPYA